MKKLTVLGSGLLLLLAFSSCGKCMVDDCQLIRAKIIRYDCDRVIFQLLTTANIGDAAWKDANSGTIYRNVVSYYNTCKIDGLANGISDTLYVRVKLTNENLKNPGCYQCLATSAEPPQTRVEFTEISLSPCDGEGKD